MTNDNQVKSSQHPFIDGDGVYCVCIIDIWPIGINCKLLKRKKMNSYVFF